MRTKAELARLIEDRIPQCDTLARAGKLSDALDILHALEKESRVINDVFANKQIMVKIVELCIDTRRWEVLCEEIVLLSKRKGILMQAFVNLVDMGCKLVTQAPNKSVELPLIQALRQACAGKMQVELQRARLTRRLATIREEEGDIAAAADILQELHIENTGVMEPHEKVDFVLEQIRLCLYNKDYLKASIVSRRVNLKFFEDKNHDNLELRYFHLMVEIDLHDREYFKVCQHYLRLQKVYERQGQKENSIEMLRFAIIFIVLSKMTEPEHLDLMKSIRKSNSKLISVQMDSVYGELLKQFTGKELISWRLLCSAVEESLRSASGTGGNIAHKQGLFEPNTIEGDQRWKDFELRTIEFNIRVISSFYSQISLKRMAELLELEKPEMESVLCELIVNKHVQAKVDRLAGIVTFTSGLKKGSIEPMNELADNWSKLMKMMEAGIHLISREEMAFNAVKAATRA